MKFPVDFSLIRSLTCSGHNLHSRLSTQPLEEGVLPLQTKSGVFYDGAAARAFEPLDALEHGGLARGVV